jgi:hypothetical protein
MDDERRAELLAAKAKRAQAAAEADEAHKDLCLELEEKFCTELGPRGQAWEMANEDNTCGEGPICVKLGDPTAHKLWTSKPGAAPEDQYAYVAPSVIYPERARFNEIAMRRPQLLGRAVQALTNLFGFSQGVLQGKL